MTLVIREATIDDAPVFQAFVAELFGESLNVLYDQPEVPTVRYQAGLISRLCSHPASCLLLAFHDKQLAGVLDLHGFQKTQREHCAVFGMSVAKVFRNQGVGRALVEEMLHFAESNELLGRIELEVFETNIAAIHLYESMQFRHEGRKRAAVRVNDRHIDILCMALLLNELEPGEVTSPVDPLPQ